MKPSGKRIIVTGAGSGIGRELALQLLKKGAEVIALDLHESNLNELKENAGDLKVNLHAHVLDVSDKQAAEKLIQQLLERHNTIDGLINNAGIIQPFIRLAELPFDAIERVMNVNFYGPIYLIKALIEHLKSRPEAAIVNVASMGGFLPVPGQTVYGASKAALKLLTEGLYAELLNTNVYVGIVYPGAIETNITQNSGVEVPNVGEDAPSMKAMPAPKAAQQIIAAMEKKKTWVYVGSDSKTMNFLYRMNSGFATRFIAKQMKALLD